MEEVSVKDLSDSHFHILEMIKKGVDIDKILDLWKSSGGKTLIDIGIEENDFTYRKKYSANYNFIFHSIGIHPNNAGGDIDHRLAILENHLINDLSNSIVAIGETGLDYHWDTVAPETQKQFFIGHIELAIKYNKPIIIHNREASNDLLNILNQYKGKVKGIIHCNSSDSATVMKFIDLGFYISYAGNVTYKNNLEIQESLKCVPTNRLLIETDSPYLPPIPMRGRLNNPNNIKYTFQYVKEILKVDNLKTILNNNLIKIFNL